MHPRGRCPRSSSVVAYCRTPEKLAAFCESTGAEAGESHRDAATQDVVVTITSSRDPVLRGEWLSPGALVAAAGANVVSRRELDNTVLERASFVCCDLLEQAKLESGDLVEPVQAAVLDWLEVHELHEVVAGEVAGRQSDDDIVVFKSNGLAAWDVALGAEAVRLARERGSGRSSSVATEDFAASIVSPENVSITSGRSSKRLCCSGVRRFWTYLSSRISFSDRPRSCSRMTYRATCSSADPREKRNENMFLNPDTRRDCIPVR